MKKLLLLLCICVLLPAAGCGKTQKASSTDITVTIDGVPIRSCVTNGVPLIPAEDLLYYGFEIPEDAPQDKLSLISTEFPQTAPPKIPETVEGTVLGTLTPAEKALTINGVPISAYQISGDDTLWVRTDTLADKQDPYNQQWGYSDYNFSAVWEEAAKTLALTCFRFPVADWNKLFTDMEAMVNQPELELYTQGTPEEAPYFGALLEPRSGVLAGMLADGNGDKLENGILFHHGFASFSNYIEFDQKQDFLYHPGPAMLAKNDCLNFVAWNISDLSQAAQGEEYIRRTLDMLKTYQKPVIIRFGGEMNIGHLGDSPSAYVKTFRKVADIVHEYPDFAMMWSPNDLGSLNRPMEYYYPGDEYVDWIGISSFMKRDFLGNPQTDRTASIYFMTGEFAWPTNAVKPVLAFMEKHKINKPLAISEGAVNQKLRYDEQTDLSAWANPRLRSMYWYLAMRYPQIKLITYFNKNTNEEVMEYDLHGYPEAIEIVENALTSGAYLLNYHDTPAFSFVKAKGHVFPVQKLPLYTYAYLPEEDIRGVSYQLDGQEVAFETEIPYFTEIDGTTLSNGIHGLKIIVGGEQSTHELNYTLEKSDKQLLLR